MTIKELHERLRLLEPDTRLAITAGEVRALLNYSMALVVEDLAKKAEEKVMDYKAVGITSLRVPDLLASHSVLDYIRKHSHYGAVLSFGDWPCTMEMDD